MISEMTLAFCLYFAVLMSIGIYFYRKNTNVSDFSLADRSLNYWLTAISAQASDMSDWLFMAYPSVIYSTGFSGIWIAVGLVLFMFITWHYIAPQLRIQTEALQVVTLSSFFEKKYHDTSHIVRILSGFLCLYFFIFYIAAGLVGLGKVFEIAFSIPYHQGIIMGLIIALLYTLLGGFLAIAWSDLLQGTFLLCAIMFVPWYAFYDLEQSYVHVALSSIQTIDPFYFSVWPKDGVLVTLCSILSWGIGYFGQPHILINFMGIDDPKNLQKSKYIGCSWQILALSSAVAVGFVGKLFFSTTLQNPELVFILMVKQLFNPFFGGVILCALLAATISTMNTQALISSSLITHDLLIPFLGNKLSASYTLLLSRLTIFIIPCISLCFAWNESYSVLKLVLYAWSGLGSSFGALMILSLYAPMITKEGAIGAIIAGGLTGIVWPLLGTSIPILIAGFFNSASVAVLCSLFYSKNK